MAMPSMVAMRTSFSSDILDYITSIEEVSYKVHFVRFIFRSFEHLLGGRRMTK
jgi:hypothetical protein